MFAKTQSLVGGLVLISHMSSRSPDTQVSPNISTIIQKGSITHSMS